MSDGMNVHVEGYAKLVLPDMGDYAAVAKQLCDTALEDAKSQLHPLLHSVELRRLVQRQEFLLNFRSALERVIAQKLVFWQPDVQAVFRYDEADIQMTDTWNGSIYLLVKVPRLSNALRALAKTLDQHLVNYLRQMALPPLHTRRSILDVHQVTPRELRHGIGYGAMFFAVYSAPVKIWPQERQER
jgi:hypothetical protein